jgi:hypothetical protein
MISETVANSLTGNKPPYGSSSGGGTGGGQLAKKTVGSIEASGCRPGVVTVIDVQNVVDPQVNSCFVFAAFLFAETCSET